MFRGLFLILILLFTLTGIYLITTEKTVVIIISKSEKCNSTIELIDNIKVEPTNMKY